MSIGVGTYGDPKAYEIKCLEAKISVIETMLEAAIQQLKRDYGVELGQEKKPNVVEVVRCKDCKFCHHRVSKQNKEHHYWCYKHAKDDSEFRTSADGFCNHGERKNDEKSEV